MSETEIEVVNLRDKFAKFTDQWRARVVGELNDTFVKLVKIKGEFIWHHHEEEDELFFIAQGRLLMKFRDGDVWINEGEFLIVPRGVEHCPVAPEEVHIMLVEPKSTVNTGNVVSERTVTEFKRI